MIQVPVHLSKIESLPTADEMVDMAKTASQSMFEREGFVQTVSIFYRDAPNSSAALVCAADFPNKATWVGFLRELAEEFRPQAVVTSTEVWMVDKPLSEDNENTIPSLDPDRVEYLMVTVENKSGMSAWRARIEREVPGDEKSKGTLGKWEVMTVNTRGVGTFSDYFWAAPKA